MGLILTYNLILTWEGLLFLKEINHSQIARAGSCIVTKYPTPYFHPSTCSYFLRTPAYQALRLFHLSLLLRFGPGVQTGYPVLDMVLGVLKAYVSQHSVITSYNDPDRGPHIILLIEGKASLRFLTS